MQNINIRSLLDHYFTRKDNMTDQKETTVVKPAEPFFPFALDDLQYWVIKRKDGMTVKYRVVGADDSTPIKVAGYIPSTTTPTTPSLSGWCKHNPSTNPIWDGGERFDLYIADAPGCRAYKDEFDLILDCGDILPLSYVRGSNQSLLDGDEELVKLLKKYEKADPNTSRVLKIDWDDRAAPPLKFEFWPALFKKLSGSVLTACQGGHGRSGTSLVCLLMVANPDYTPADAIIHLRALHCPRAIESGVQHTYIGEFGAFLGRVNDVERIKDVKDFKAEFLKMTYESVKPYQTQLLKGAK